jgi:hypothetical protein
VKQYPKLNAMLVEAQLRGGPWTEILKMLQEKIALPK